MFIVRKWSKCGWKSFSFQFVCACVCVRERRKIERTAIGKKVSTRPVPLGYAPIMLPITPRGQACIASVAGNKHFRHSPPAPSWNTIMQRNTPTPLCGTATSGKDLRWVGRRDLRWVGRSVPQKDAVCVCVFMTDRMALIPTLYTQMTANQMFPQQWRGREGDLLFYVYHCPRTWMLKSECALPQMRKTSSSCKRTDGRLGAKGKVIGYVIIGYVEWTLCIIGSHVFEPCPPFWLLSTVVAKDAVSSFQSDSEYRHFELDISSWAVENVSWRPGSPISRLCLIFDQAKHASAFLLMAASWASFFPSFVFSISWPGLLVLALEG